MNDRRAARTLDASWLQIGPHVTALPVVHGSGDFAWEVRRLMGSAPFDCLAVPLPPSFQEPVEQAILDLPTPGIVIQRSWTAPAEFDPHAPPAEESESVSHVPIDPCQPVIAALRIALEERLPRRFIDLETSRFEEHTERLPDPYALKRVPLEKFSAAVAPHLTAPRSRQWQRRMEAMAWHLRELSVDYRKILFVPSLLEWPWIRQAFLSDTLRPPEDEAVTDPKRFRVDPRMLYFLLGELPFVTGLYERARQELAPDHNLAIDGIKELLIAARERYRRDFGSRARRITPKLLAQCLQYLRNLTLIERCFSPQLVSIVTAAKQVAGDGYALHVLETARDYGHPLPRADNENTVRMGIGEIGFPDGELRTAANRLPGPPVVWKSIELIPRPDRRQQQQWQQRWNPYGQCSWPPEDELIEKFRQTVFERAKQAVGEDLVKTEKFTASVKDGIDIRETVRHWYDGEIHVKVIPPTRGHLDCAVLLFDTPADPRDYPWRTTWFAEHEEESTLAFYATDFRDDPVGPGICLATYGGAIFLFPPVVIPDIWSDPAFDFCSTLEERLLAAACKYSQAPHIALVSPAPPGAAWRQIARRYRRKWIHLPLSRFSDQTLQQLRMVHVLNGKQVRSYAADFIRRV